VGFELRIKTIFSEQFFFDTYFFLYITGKVFEMADKGGGKVDGFGHARISSTDAARISFPFLFASLYSFIAPRASLISKSADFS